MLMKWTTAWQWEEPGLKWTYFSHIEEVSILKLLIGVDYGVANISTTVLPVNFGSANFGKQYSKIKKD